MSQQQAPSAFDNALFWTMEPMENGLLPGHTIVLQGRAVKRQRNVNFLLGFRLLVRYFCGEFIEH